MRPSHPWSVLMPLVLALAACGGTVAGSTHEEDASTKEAGHSRDTGDTDVDYCALTPPDCPASFDSSKACGATAQPCQTLLCEACSENAYSLDQTTFYCQGGKWTQAVCAAGDCGSGGPGPGMPGTYADPKCKTVWLADGGVGPVADGGVDGG
jgi:hypothetical protein